MAELVFVKTADLVVKIDSLWHKLHVELSG